MIWFIRKIVAQIRFRMGWELSTLLLIDDVYMELENDCVTFRALPKLYGYLGTMLPLVIYKKKWKSLRRMEASVDPLRSYPLAHEVRDAVVEVHAIIAKAGYIDFLMVALEQDFGKVRKRAEARNALN